MNKKSIFARAAVGAIGGMMLIGVAGAAIADEVDEDSVEVNVEIAGPEPVGALTMTVAQASTSLAEATATDEGYRVFTGTLPTVTVTDDRDTVPAGVFWYVLGQATEFSATGVTETIGADRLGWTPNLITPADNGEVAEGDGTVPSVDAESSEGSNNNVGLVGEELLALALDSGEARPTGSWSADAGLTLKADADVAPGSYASKITLTLWEDAQ